MRSTKKLYTVGKFWLEAPSGRYTSYRICWTNSSTKQTDRVSTRTGDFETAKKAIHEHYLKEGTGEKLKDEPLLTSMQRYYHKVVKGRPDETTYLMAMADIARILASPMVSEMRSANQEKLIDGYRREGFADSTIIRRMACVWASMNYAVELEHIDPSAIPAKLSTTRWGAKKGKTKRLLTLDQVGKLLDAACSTFHSDWNPILRRPRKTSHSYAIRWKDPATGTWLERSLETRDEVEATQKCKAFMDEFRSAHPDRWTIHYGWEWRYLVLLLGTGARSRAITDLCVGQIEHVTSDHAVIHLNPPERVQTTKYRPTIPIAPILGDWLKTWQPMTPQGHLAMNLKCAAANMVAQNLFRQLSVRVGFAVTAHMIRHFVSTWLSKSARVQSLWERDRFMGWKRDEGSAMGGVYGHYDPRYLRGAALAIQDLFEALAPHTYADLLKRGFDDQPLPEEVLGHVPALPPSRPGCLVLIPARSVPQVHDDRQSG